MKRLSPLLALALLACAAPAPELEAPQAVIAPAPIAPAPAEPLADTGVESDLRCGGDGIGGTGCPEV